MVPIYPPLIFTEVLCDDRTCPEKPVSWNGTEQDKANKRHIVRHPWNEYIWVPIYPPLIFTE